MLLGGYNRRSHYCFGLETAVGPPHNNRLKNRLRSANDVIKEQD